MFPRSLLAGGYNPFEEYWSNWIFPPSNLTRLIGMHWSALRQHGISGHLMWIWQCMYYGQTGVIRERDVDRYVGCVLSPRLFSGCWKWPCPPGVRKWKLKDCPLKMASNHCWIYDLLMTYLCFVQHWNNT